MTDLLAFAVTITSLLVGIVVLVLLLTGRYRWRRVLPALVVVELAVLLLVGMDIVGLLTGTHPVEPATHIAYVVTTALILPVLAGYAARDTDRWAGSLVVLALLVLAVLVVRLTTTGRPV
jgi:uncharacterized membrane protein